jgi:hypothetical protein
MEQEVITVNTNSLDDKKERNMSLRVTGSGGP